jgi:hypothetical protein
MLIPLTVYYFFRVRLYQHDAKFYKKIIIELNEKVAMLEKKNQKLVDKAKRKVVE